jgi:hypothetical protein
MIARHRQGLCLAIAGAILGFAYWILAEKKVTGEWHRHPILSVRSRLIGNSDIKRMLVKILFGSE